MDRLRQSASAVVCLICMALLGMWLTGTHGHRHVGGNHHDDRLHGQSETLLRHDHASESAHWPSGTVEPDVRQDADHIASHSVHLIHADGHENIELKGVHAPGGSPSVSAPALALLFYVAFVLARTRPHFVPAISDPPRPVRERSLRPPLRGPPSFSVV